MAGTTFWPSKDLADARTDSGLSALDDMVARFSEKYLNPQPSPAEQAPVSLAHLLPSLTPWMPKAAPPSAPSLPTVGHADTTLPPTGVAGPQAPSGQPRAMPAGGVGAPSSQVSAPAQAAGPIDNTNRSTFARTAYPLALQAAGGDPELAKRLLAMAVSENGTVGSGGQIGVGFNFGGIKYDPQASGSGNYATWESEGGQRVNQNADFASYATVQDGFNAIPRFIQTNMPQAWARYQQTHDAAGLIRDINAAGYATNPAWHQAIEGIVGHDVAPSLTAGPTPAGSPPPAPAAPSPPPLAAGGSNYKVSDTLPADDPNAPSAGDQKRARLIGAQAASGTPQEMPVAPMKDGQAILPAPDGAYDVVSQPVPLRGQRVNAPYDPGSAADGSTYGVQYRQPLYPTDPEASTGADLPYDPRDADQGAHETGYTVGGAEVAGGTSAGSIPAPEAQGLEPVSGSSAVEQPPATYAASQDDPGQAPYVPPATYNDPTDGGTQSQPLPAQTAPVQPPAGFPGLQAVYDAGGNFLHWIQGAAQGAVDQIGANVAANQQAVTDANAATGAPDANPLSTGVTTLAAGLTDPGNVTAALDAARQAYNDPMWQAMPAPARAAYIVSQTGQAYGDAAGRAVARMLGVEDSEVATILGHPITGGDVAGFVGGSLLDPTQYVGAGEARTAATAVREAAPEAVSAGRGLAQAAGERFGSALDANAGRVAAADARMARQGSVAAPGTLGVISNNPLEASTAARSRIVPPDVADTLDFPVRIPEDPSFHRAVEAAGGNIDPERGVNLNVIRYQGPEAHGRPATRASTFYTAGKPGEASPYAAGAGAQVGGTDRIEGPTRFRSPLVLDAPPGDNKGFDAGIKQLGADKHPDVLRAEQDLQQAEAALAQANGQSQAGARRYYRDKPDAEKYGPFYSDTPEGQQLEQQADAAYRAIKQAKEARIQALAAHPPIRAHTIDRGIEQARAAGPPGSPARAQALKDLVSKYGGDPSVIDDLISVRGADHPESAWAIKENILAHNARRAGYDGVLTVQPHAPTQTDIEAHPAVKQAAQAFEAAIDQYGPVNRQYEQAREAYGQARVAGMKVHGLIGLSDDVPEIKPAAQALTEASAARDAAQQRMDQAAAAYKAAEAQARQELQGHKITELADFRESHNPTPSAHPRVAELEQTIQQAEIDLEQARRAYDALNYRPRAGATVPPEVDAAYRRYAAISENLNEYYRELTQLKQAPNTGSGGYTLRSDMRRRGGETSATLTPGVGASTRLIGDLGNAIGGGVGGATIGAGLPAENDEQRRRNALIGAGVGMLAGPAAGRLMSREGGALATFGVSPAGGTVKSPSQSANPNIRNVARMMSGDYKPVGTERSLGERIVAALTDRYAIHANVAAEGRARALAAGGTAPVERLAERVRENPNSIAAQRTRETLAPALQSLGSDAEWAAQYLVHRHNLDIAKAKAQEVYDAAIAKGSSPNVAQRLADRVRTSRQFSGGMTEKEIVQAISDMQTEIGPSRFRKVVDASQAFWDSGRENLQRKLDEGIIDQGTFDTLTQKYPHYVRTDIADYAEKGPASPSPGGKALGIGNNGIKVLSIEGTSKDRVNPILSTIDAVYGTENAITRNKAARDLVAVRDADPTTAGLFREVAPDAKAYRGNQQTMVPPDYTLRNGEQKLTQWENGVARQFVIPREYAQLLTPNPGALLGDTASPVRTFMGVMKALITTHNPAFQYIVSPVRDVGDALVSMQTAAGAAARRPGASSVENTAREVVGSVAAIPEAVYRLGEAIPQAFQGFMSNNVGPRAAELRRAGMGFEGRPSREKDLREAMRELQRSGGVEIKTPGDALRIGRTILSLGAERVGNRLEMVPRIAAANMERARGGDSLSQSIAGKDATVDFLRGGWLTRQLNVPMMYLNPTVQAAAQNARLYRKSPAAFTAALITTVGIPALLSEAWNRSDPERAKAYEDRPDYLSNTGIVWEMPSLPQGTGPLKEALPNFVWQPLGNHAFAARLAREALGLLDSKTGLIPPTPTPAADRSDPAYWVKLGTDLLGMFSPVKGGDVSSSVASLVPPVASEVLDIAANKDLYTGATVATDRTDERASNLSKTIAGGANSLLGTEWRPSQVEHAIAGPTGYAGQLARAASDIGREKEQTRPIQDIPVVGGLANRIIRDTGGQRLQEERDAAAASPAVRQALRDAGLRSDELGMPTSNIRDLPITRQEQAAYQRDFNAALDKNVRDALADPDWKTMSEFERARWLKNLATQARQEAGGNVVGGWDDPTLEFRADKKAEKRTGTGP